MPSARMRSPVTIIFNRTDSRSGRFSGIAGKAGFMSISSLGERPRGLERSRPWREGTIGAEGRKGRTGSWRKCGNRVQGRGLRYIRAMTGALIALVDDEETLRETVGFAL